MCTKRSNKIYAHPTRSAKLTGQFPALIPGLTDQNPCAQSRVPMDMVVNGWSMSLFQASIVHLRKNHNLRLCLASSVCFAKDLNCVAPQSSRSGSAVLMTNLIRFAIFDQNVTDLRIRSVSPVGNRSLSNGRRPRRNTSLLGFDDGISFARTKRAPKHGLARC